MNPKQIVFVVEAADHGPWIRVLTTENHHTLGKLLPCTVFTSPIKALEYIQQAMDNIWGENYAS